MAKGYVLAIDAGTTSNRAILFDRASTIVGVVQKEFTQFFPCPGWVEHDPEEIWATVVAAVREVLEASGVSAGEVEAIGITNQRETTVVWDRASGTPIYPAIVWQCRRAAQWCAELECVDAGMVERIRAKTGLVLDPYFSGPKIRWILDHVEGAQERAERGELMFGTVETWLIWKLTGGRRHVTDVSNASRTMLFNIHELDWDEELLGVMRVPRAMLPEVRPSSEIYGVSEAELWGASIPIAGAAGDQQAALFGQHCWESGEGKNTYGTGCFLLLNTGTQAIRSKHGLVTTIAWGLGGSVTYALEGSVFVAGAAIQWLRDELGLLTTASESEAVARSVSDTNGCVVVPAFTGLGAPYWRPEARGMITGLTRGVNRAHIVRATLDSIALQVVDVLDAMREDAGLALSDLKVDGGASANGYLMQTQADLGAVRVHRPACIESTALGAAYLAGLATGFWADMRDVRESASFSEEVFEPMLEEKLRQERMEMWRRTVAQA